MIISELFFVQKMYKFPRKIGRLTSEYLLN